MCHIQKKKEGICDTSILRPMLRSTTSKPNSALDVPYIKIWTCDTSIWCPLFKANLEHCMNIICATYTEMDTWSIYLASIMQWHWIQAKSQALNADVPHIKKWTHDTSISCPVCKGIGYKPNTKMHIAVITQAHC